MVFKTINQIPLNRCTGCMTCKYVCKHNAIEGQKDCQGFRTPVISPDMCVDCGECYRKCPVNRVDSLDEVHAVYAYAVMADNETRSVSSSGGAFTVVANYILKNGGKVIGASFLNHYTVMHEMIADCSELSKLQKSKYVQSDIFKSFEDIKRCLAEETDVLFVGTPCQVAAVRSVFGDCDRLFLIDIMCMGVSSSDCLQKYFDEEMPNSKIEYIDFRYKKNDDWNQNLLLNIKTRDYEKIIPYEESSYFLAFLKGLSLRSSCLQCDYAGKERIGDITLGDFWGIGAYKSELDDGKGTSLLLVNSPKGEALFEKIRYDFKVAEEVPFEIASKGNSTLIRQLPRNKKSVRFWENYYSKSLKDNLRDMLDDSADCGIINYWYTNDHGAILTAFALQQFLKKNGYTSKLINIAPEQYNRSGGISEKFEVAFLESTYERINSESLGSLNDKFKYFLVGSDQVFRAEWVSDNWFLDFVNIEKNKIAVSASFGTDSLNVSRMRRKRIRYLLNRFNNVSVREKSGVEICRKQGISNAEWILDPVFLIDKSIYEQIARHPKHRSKFVFCYVRDRSKEINAQISTYAKENGLEMIFCNEKMPVEDFLGHILECDSFVTDSYHGLCFAIIFEKKVFFYINERRGATRFDSLIEQLAIPSAAIVHGFDERLSEKESYSYLSTSELLARERKRSSEWILKCLECPAQIKKGKLFLCWITQFSFLAIIKMSVKRIIRLFSKLRRRIKKNG